ncbi:autotransporter adhesin [Variovorax boronicumulans]|uniref:ESPR-type extended signal peptide-containing protein n=1 Tax=Variovorax boronicumulans TaxID=436515 RepID=UPI00278196AC|nr:YadA-like family protein [Variovorax boronicumulans]MDQ0086121.1 autotransporter adhesin [Variovorax boronicumulans]
MNKIHKTIWNNALGAWVAASEVTKSPRGGKSSGVSGAVVSAVALAALSALAPSSVFAQSVCEPGLGTATGVNSLVCGVGASATALNTTAVGNGAIANQQNSTAVGTNARALADSALAVGSTAAASGFQSTAVGTSSTAASFNDSAFGVGSSATGGNSTALGTASNASQASSVAVGSGARSTGIGSTSVGANANASTESSLAVGSSAAASGFQATAVGSSSVASAANAAAFGVGAQATGLNALAMGNASSATREGSVALGAGAQSTGIGSTADGNNARASGESSAALGSSSVASGLQATAVGSASSATGVNASAFGVAANATGSNSLALGTASVAAQDGAVALGAGSVTAAVVATPSGVLNGTTYNYAGGAPTSTVSVGDVSLQRTITNVAAGRINSTSTDAINGSQLDATNQEVTKLGTGAAGLVQFSNAGTPTTPNGGTPTNDMTLVGAAPGAPVGLHNVAPGSVAATSTDAINGSQLNKMGTSVASGLGGGSTFDPTTGTVTAPSYTVQGNTYNNVGSALGGIDSNLTTLNTQVSNINNGAGIKYFHANSTLADSTATGTDSVAVGPRADASAGNAVALGNGAKATFANSVALGANSVTAVGAQTGYTAFGLTAAQNSAGEVSVGAAGAERKVTNVAAGSDDTDAVNVSQLKTVSQNSLQYDKNPDGTTNFNSITLGGTGATTPTVIHNVGPGVAPTDAVNMSQLDSATNTASNKWIIGNPTTYVAPTAAGPNSTAIGSGATATGNNSVALGAGSSDGGQSNVVSVGSVGAERRVINVAAGNLSATSTDAVNGSQLYATNQNVANLTNQINAVEQGGVKYDKNPDGTVNNNSVTLGNGSGPTAVHNVADGAVNATSHDAVNGSQLYSVQQQIQSGNSGGLANNNTSGAPAPKATGRDSVAIGSGSTADRDNTVSVGSPGKERQITNVADGTQPTDAVNRRQLDTGVKSAIDQSRAYTDGQIGSLRGELKSVSKTANAGSAAALAAGALPQSIYAGKSLVSAAVGSYKGQAALAIGLSSVADGGRWIFKVSGTADTSGNVGVAAGAGFHW